MNQPTIEATFAERRDAAFAPIVSKDDPRYTSLQEHLVSHGWSDANLENMEPSKLGHLYVSSIFQETVPEFEGETPAWATQTLETGLVANTLFPAALWVRPLIDDEHFTARLEQDAEFNPDTREVTTPEEILLSVSIGDHNEALNFAKPEHAREAGEKLIAAAAAWAALAAS